MTNQHPITPPLELVGQWSDTIYQMTAADDERDLYIATQAARWGADQELDACCKWLECNYNYPQANPLRVARRPKPPSLKEQALALVSHNFSDQPCLSEEGYALIRRALEALPE